MKLRCFECNAVCSTNAPEDFVLRGTITCPECEEKKTPKCLDCGKVISDGCGIEKTENGVKTFIPLCGVCTSRRVFKTDRVIR